MTKRLRRHSQNHSSIYTAKMSHGSRRRFAQAQNLNGIDMEVAIIRLRLRQLLMNHRDDHALFFKTIQLLIRAVTAQARIPTNSSNPTERLIENVLTDVGLKLGLDRIPWPSSPSSLPTPPNPI